MYIVKLKMIMSIIFYTLFPSINEITSKTNTLNLYLIGRICGEFIKVFFDFYFNINGLTITSLASR